MKILVDPQIYNSQVYGGISRYYTEVLSELSKRQDIIIEVPVLLTGNEYLKASRLYNVRNWRYAAIVTILSKLGVSTRKRVKKWNEAKTITALQKRDYDVLIPTYYNPYFLDYTADKPFVLTVYDMIHELFPQYFSDAKEITANKLLLMQKAAKIIAVSHNTKKDIVKFYPGLDAAKIEVVYHGSSISINEHSNVDLPDNYILFVGVRDNYKNFTFLVDAITSLFNADASLHLVCAGGGRFTISETAFLTSKNLAKRVIHKSFNEDELGQFYKKARCFVFPSAYEGFGIPVLEAMACGCPIVLTNNSSFPEVSGDAGIFYELGNKADLKDKIEWVIYNEDVREAYIAKGLEQVKKFTWKDAAAKCLAVYRDAANQ